MARGWKWRNKYQSFEFPNDQKREKLIEEKTNQQCGAMGSRIVIKDNENMSIEHYRIVTEIAQVVFSKLINLNLIMIPQSVGVAFFLFKNRQQSDGLLCG